MPVPSSVTAQQGYMNSSRARVVNRGSRSTPRIASTARPATSRTRPRTSTGSLPKAAEARITRTCKLLIASAFAAVAVSAPASAMSRLDPSRVYLAAKAAAIEGNHVRSAQLLAQLVETSNASQSVTIEALTQAISAGDTKLALRLVKSVPVASLPIEGRFLLIAEALRTNDTARA